MRISDTQSIPAMVRAYAGRSMGLLVPLLAFAIPVSTSAVSVLAILVFIAWFLSGEYARKGAAMVRNPVSLTLLCYLGVFVLGLLWTRDLDTGLEEISKQWKLLLLPLLISLSTFPPRRRCVAAFIAGLSVTMLMTYLAWFDVLHFGGVTPEHPTRRLFHVVYNPLLAFGFYLVCHETIWGTRSGKTRLFLSILAAFMAFDMFITEGRTGQVVFFVLVFLLLIQLCNRSLWKGVGLAVLVLPLIFAGAYRFSSTFQGRMDSVVREVSQFRDNPNTSVGLRLLFWTNSGRIIGEHPFLGVGTGDFQDEYARVNRVHSPHMVATDNPHNQYVFTLCRFGIPGLVTLLAMFAVQIRQAVVIEDRWQRVRFAFPVFFLTIMLAESYLRIYETGFFFAVFAAVFYRLDTPAGG